MAQENNPSGNNPVGNAVGEALAWAFVHTFKVLVYGVELLIKMDKAGEPRAGTSSPGPAKTATSTSPLNAKIGDAMDDGTLYAGVSPDTRQPLYAAPKDAPVCMSFNQAAKYAKSLEVGGKKGFHIPTKAELAVLFENRDKGALKGTFNVAGAFPAGWYWASRPDNFHSAWLQRFSDGDCAYNFKVFASSVRCVR